MKDNTDYGALRRELALLCCQLRGLNPEHIAPGTTDPLWKTPRIMDAVALMMSIAGSDEATRLHAEAAAAEHDDATTLIERRAFSLNVGTITSLIDQVLGTRRNGEVLIVINEMAIPVMPDDDHQTVRSRWLKMRSSGEE